VLVPGPRHEAAPPVPDFVRLIRRIKMGNIKRPHCGEEVDRRGNVITVYKVTLVGYLVDEDFGGEGPPPEDWTPQQILESMDPNIEKIVVQLDFIPEAN
jgi:hypothetical protein